MLSELTMRDFALIESLTISFGPNLNVLTGETGAGKSIVVDAVTLALGGRAERGMVRTGCERAIVQAAFDISENPRVRAMLTDMGVPVEDDLLLITREIHSGGRNVQRMGGILVPLAQLKSVTALLMDVHGQHEHQSLMDDKRHIVFLDAQGGEGHRQLIARLAQAYARWREDKRELKRILESEADRAQRLDMLTFQNEELTKARLKEGEDASLEQRLRLMGNAGKITDALELAYHLLYEGAERRPSAQAQLKEASDALLQIAEYGPRFSAMSDRLSEMYYMAQEAGYELLDMRENIEFDPQLADRISRRIALLDKLKRKYGPSLEDVIAYRDQIALELEGWEEGEALAERARQALETSEAELMELTEALTEQRMALKTRFEEALLRQLRELGMERAQFSVRMEKKPVGESGQDQVRFLLSPNPGEPLKPLSAIASGGELSRIMLALKSIEAGQADIGTMVFDEIDTGISGKMAQVVAEKMAALAGHRQVICVTHLPQIAAMADSQYLVEKRVEGGRTLTQVIGLNRDLRAQVLSRMVGGADELGSGLSHARAMLDAAEKARARLRGQA